MFSSHFNCLCSIDRLIASSSIDLSLSFPWKHVLGRLSHAYVPIRIREIPVLGRFRFHVFENRKTGSGWNQNRCTPGWKHGELFLNHLMALEKKKLKQRALLHMLVKVLLGKMVIGVGKNFCKLGNLTDERGDNLCNLGNTDVIVYNVGNKLPPITTQRSYCISLHFQSNK